MMKYYLLVIVVIVSSLFSLSGCLPDTPKATMELYVENTTARPLVVAVNGVNYGEIPPNAMSEFLLFDRNSEEYVISVYDTSKELLFEKTYQNNELKKIGVDKNTTYEIYKLVIIPFSP
jgi:hypothetical protein